jgi:hypothetical protein
MKKKYIFLIILVVIMVVGAVYFLNKPLSCQNLYNEIENDLDEANYCQVDTDCDVIMLGGWYIDFGCYHFVNKEVNQNAILSKMETYKDKMRCSQIINDCAPAPDVKCISNKCVHVSE